ncbi:ParA family protein [Jatrophihabitans sp. DSM 45814]
MPDEAAIDVSRETHDARPELADNTSDGASEEISVVKDGSPGAAPRVITDVRDDTDGWSTVTQTRGTLSEVSRETSADQELPTADPAFDVSRETSSPQQSPKADPAFNVSRETSATETPGNAGELVTDHLSSILDSEDGSTAHVSRETSPIEREAMQAVHVRNVRQEVWPRPPERRILTIANQKGGVGKTTTAVNIAVALAQHGLRVLLIDLDPQGNASTALGVDHSVGTPSVYDVLLGGATLAEVSAVVEVAPTLRCVPATIDLAGADIELASQVAREHRLRRAVAEYREEVDYILIDCPPTLGLLTLNALVAAREILIPIQCEYYALEGLAQLLNTVELVKTQLNSTLEVTTVLLTMYDSRTKLADQVADEVRNHFGPKVIQSVIPRNVRVSEAPGYGQTVMTYDAGSRGAIGYLEAARELAARGAEQSNAGQSGSTSASGE